MWTWYLYRPRLRWKPRRSNHCPRHEKARTCPGFFSYLSNYLRLGSVMLSPTYFFAAAAFAARCLRTSLGSAISGR